MNFRDVLVALGMYPGGGELGVEGAGVVIEVGPGVTEYAVGEAVMGLFGVVGSEAVVDARLVTAVPAGWSLVQAAGVPVVFLTALYGLSVLAGLRAASGCWCMPQPVGWGWRRCSWPAIGARRCSPRPARASGIRCARWALMTITSAIHARWSSRKVLTTTGGSGVDVVLNSLAATSWTRHCGCWSPVAGLSKWVRPISATRGRWRPIIRAWRIGRSI